MRPVKLLLTTLFITLCSSVFAETTFNTSSTQVDETTLHFKFPDHFRHMGELPSPLKEALENNNLSIRTPLPSKVSEQREMLGQNSQVVAFNSNGDKAKVKVDSTFDITVRLSYLEKKPVYIVDYTLEIQADLKMVKLKYSSVIKGKRDEYITIPSDLVPTEAEVVSEATS